MRRHRQRANAEVVRATIRLWAKVARDMADVLVLCYHAVSERWPAELAVTPEALESQLKYLLGRGYRGATFQEAIEAPPGPRTVAVTFDDAYRSVGELAYPILAELGLPGTVFVPTDFPDTGRAMRWPGIDRWLGGPHEHELMALAWLELEQLCDAGWEVGSHTCSHPRLTALDQEELERELRHSRTLCETRLRRRCDSLAYPYGDVDGRVVGAAREAGYRFATDLPERMRSPTALVWPRVGVYQADSLERFKRQVSPWTRRLQVAAPGLASRLGRARGSLTSATRRWRAQPH